MVSEIDDKDRQVRDKKFEKEKEISDYNYS